MKKWPFWIKGGLIALPLSVLIIPISLYITQLLGAGQDALWFIVPEYYTAALGLGMRGTPASSQEVVSTLVIVTLLFALRIFVIGAILGAIYSIFAKKEKRKWFFVGLAVIYLLALGLLSYRTQSPRYMSLNSPSECASILKKGIDNFDENYCYKEQAVKNEDVAICDRINVDNKTTEDFKAFCCEEVAHAKDDPLICDLISEGNFDDSKGTTRRKDSCYGWFKLCEKIISISWRDHCYMNKAEFQNDISACNFVINSKDQCYLRAGTNNKR